MNNNNNINNRRKRNDTGKRRNVSATVRSDIRRSDSNASGRRNEARRPAKKKSGIRIGGFIIRPRLIIGLAVIVAAIIVIINISPKEPECYELNRSSITIYEDAQALLIKSERGYSYPEGATVISRVNDGTLVNSGDKIAVIRTASFNDDWYAQLEIARRNTINYMLERLSDENETLKNALDIVDSQIESISNDMINTIAYEPSRYNEYSEKLRQLYIEKRDMVLEVFGTDKNITDYLNKEQIIQDKINSCTQDVYAPKSGMVSYNTDGYANLYNYENIDAVTQTAFHNILKDNCSLSIKNSRSSCDYFISDMTKCYIIMEGTGNTLKYIQVNDEAIIRIDNGDLQYIATVRKAEHGSESSFIAVEPVGSFPEMYRERTLDITVQKTWSGLVVPKEHIVKKKDKTGVYVYADGKKTFVPITVLVENENVVILDTTSVDNTFVQGMMIVKQK